MRTSIKEMGLFAKKAARRLCRATPDEKNRILARIADGLVDNEEAILKANDLDVKVAKDSGMGEALLDRLILRGRIAGIAEDVWHVIDLPDPVGKIIEHRTLPNGLELSKQRTPIGVLGVIYESRPNVTVDISALSIKTGNCAILRGGSETITSNTVLANIIQSALKEEGFPEKVIQFIDDPNRALVTDLLHQHETVDMIIPRGGEGLHRFCRENSQIPVITGGLGICHLYVDESADLERTLEVIYNAKTQRPTVCNALDTLLVNDKVADAVIPKIIQKLEGVSFRLDPKAWKYRIGSSCQEAQEGDWDTEWLSLVLGIKVVNDLNEAIDHIQEHSSGHSDGILTQNTEHADQFINEVDSASVYVNASTRFTDGSQFGLGAEVAVSTQKLHARGPMGLEELTTYKWVVKGDYHVRK